MVKYFKNILIILFLSLSLNGYAQTWYDLTKEGLDAYNKRKFELAISCFDKCLVIALKESGKESSMYTATLNNLGQAYKEIGEYTKAESYFNEALSITEKLSGKLCFEYANTTHNLGTLYKIQAKYNKAYSFYADAYEIVKQIYKADDPKTAMYLNSLAGICFELNKFDEAEQYYLQAIDILKSNNLTLNVKYTFCLNNLSQVYRSKGDYIKAEPLLKESLEIRKQLSGENSFDVGSATYNLATFYEQMGHYDEAEILLYSSLKIYENTVGKDSPEYMQNLNGLGVLYVNTNNYQKAEELLLMAFDTGVRIYKSLPPTFAEILDNLAVVYTSTGNYEQAEIYALQAIDITEKLVGENSTHYTNQLNNLGMLYYYMERYDDSERILLKSLKLKEKILGPDNIDITEVLNSLGALYQLRGDYNEAEKICERSLAIIQKVFDRSHPQYFICELNFATVLLNKGEYSKAMTHLKEAIAGLQMNVHSSSTFMSEMEFNEFLNNKVNILTACESFEIKLRDSVPEVTALMYDLRLFIDGIQLKTASSLKKDIMNSKDTSLIGTYWEWVDFNSQISNQFNLPINDRNPDLDIWQKQANDLEKILMRGSQTFKNNRQAESIDHKTIRDNLEPNEATLEFISFHYTNGIRWTDSIYYNVVLLRPGDDMPIYIPLFEEKQLLGLLRGDSLRTFANLLYNQAQIRNVDHDITYGDSLYKLIWEPIEPYLKGIQRIYYSPSGLLHKLAIDAIPFEEGRVLSDKYNMDRLTTISKLVEKNSDPFDPTSITLYGGIQYDVDTTEMKILVKDQNNSNKTEDPEFSSFRSDSRGGIWTYLFGAKKEVEGIADIFEKKNITTVVYTDKKGTEESLKNLVADKSPSILHLSTHGFFFPDQTKKDLVDLNSNVFKVAEDPLLRSGLIFSGANYVWKGGKPIKGIEDGILTAYEVSNLYLPNTRLVVMSACETGLGDIKGSEGVYGLQRAFKIAGVDYIIMTLWQVLDKETSDFMTLFYQNLLDKRSIPDAFKTTQDFMKNKYRDEPYKWAGFVLIK